jgi:mono/diheme cytochrome c family protein
MKTAATRIVGSTLVFFSLGGLWAQPQQVTVPGEKQASTKKAPTPNQTPATTESDPGERKFQTNCSRCHTAPEQLSSRFAGTVLRHMRVRASLSADDERDILRYLAP